DRPFLIDAGRRGAGEELFQMMDGVGVSPADLAFVLLTHGHEDHDGALPEIVPRIGLTVKAHHIYGSLIRFYPEEAPPAVRKDFPAACWRCAMPESFSRKYCVDYHRERSVLEIEGIGDGTKELGSGIVSHHLPGHSPDALCVLLGEEAIAVGDTLLPEISPSPSQEGFFELVRSILEPAYSDPQAVYGLRSFIRSLKRLGKIAEAHPDLLVLPGHRLFFNNRWNEVVLNERVRELIRHHIDRCAAMLEILERGPKTAREIAAEYFEERLLKGFGMIMAENEVISHCELLIAAGDAAAKDGRYHATGAGQFESLIDSLEPAT
ncbi:MAG: MBL fold metallo-hydrolase, partial [Deltaproteobacteria bacterium]|nr:MBL fold metallo-hydrolase [Deltaproteobacteria bacterium]